MNATAYTTRETIATLTAGGVKASAQRIAILRFLMGNRTHPTVDEIFKALQPTNPTLSRTTVYNTLRLLTETGIIRCIGTGCGDGARWDYSTQDHAHFLCTSCGHVTDINYSFSSTTFPLPPAGYTVKTADIILKGICPHCAQTQPRELNPDTRHAGPTG